MLDTYANLSQSIADWTKRTDLTAFIPDFITLLESKFSRDLRIRAMLTTATLTSTASSRTLALPTDWLEFDSVVLVGQPNRVLTYVTNETLDNNFPENATYSKPEVYTIVGSNMELGPVPDASYQLAVTYYKKFDSIQTAGTNWLLTNHPSLYLFGALIEASAFGFADERLPLWVQRFNSEIESLKVADERSNWSGSALRVRVAV